MTVQTLPWAIQGQTHPGEVARNEVSAAFGAPVAALVAGVGITTAGGAHGVVGAADLTVTQRGAGANMSVDVSAGRALVRSTEASSVLGGTYSFLNDAVVNLVIAAADPTNPRIDIVIAQVRDSNYSGAFTDARLTVVTGTPGAVPAVPAVPNSCVVLAQVAVAALAASITNANITDKRTRAYALGGTSVSTAALAPTGPSLFEGLRQVYTDQDRILTYDGATQQRTGWYTAAGRTGFSLSGVVGGSVTLTTAVFLAATWLTEQVDTDAAVSGTGTATTTITIPAGLGGLWVFTYRGATTTTTGALFVCRISIGGIAYSATCVGGFGDYFNSLTLPVAAGTAIGVNIYQSSGANMTLSSHEFYGYRLAI